MLFLRLSHLLPFWIVIGCGDFSGQNFCVYMDDIGGNIPLVSFLAIGGQGPAHYFLSYTHFAIREIFTLNVKIALFGLGSFPAAA